MAQQPLREIPLHPLEQSSIEIDGLCDRLDGYLAELGLQLDDCSFRPCVEYLLYVLQVNRIINVTSVRDIDDALILHVVDSLSFLRGFSQSFEHARILDMGTGGGFPGVPLHLATNWSAVLVDSVAKKINVVSTICEHMGINGVFALHGRLETLANDESNRFEYVVARALAPLPVLVEYASPFLIKGGRLVVSKGSPSPDECEQGEKAAYLCGLEHAETIPFELPQAYGSRKILVYEKVIQPSIRLPRDVGLAKKSPLA